MMILINIFRALFFAPRATPAPIAPRKRRSARAIPTTDPIADLLACFERLFALWRAGKLPPEPTRAPRPASRRAPRPSPRAVVRRTHIPLRAAPARSAIHPKSRTKPAEIPRRKFSNGSQQTQNHALIVPFI
jgi:hypothetical protein